MEREWVVENILTINEPKTGRGYEITLKSKIFDKGSGQIQTESLIGKLNQMVYDDKETLELRYGAFYGLNIYYRHMKDSTKLRGLFVGLGHLFKNELTYDYLESMMLKLSYTGNQLEGNTILQKSYKAHEQIGAYNKSHAIMENLGIAHNYAESVALVAEHTIDEANGKEDKGLKEAIQQAEVLMNHIIQTDEHYAKYYCTRGRLKALNGKYEEAKMDILLAIDKENSAQKDYAIRLGDYQHFLLLINYQKHNQKLTRIVQDIDQRFQENTIKNLEILGFFVAIVSFTLGSFQLASGSAFGDAFKLVVVLMASVMAVFSGFNIIVDGSTKNKRPSIIIGLLSIAVVISMYFIK